MRTTLLALLALAAPALAQPVSLFDGKTLDGWESPSPKLWGVQDGCLTGGDGNKIPYNDFLCTKGSYANFTLHLKIKLTGDPKTGMINSGIQIRTQRNATGHEVCGYQCDYGEPNWYAAIYDEGRRNRLMMKSNMEALRPVINLWGWNDYVIRAEGPHIQTWINGVQGVDYVEQDANVPSDGIIGIQIHGGGNTQVQVKDVTIEELPPTKGAPTWKSLGGVEAVKKLLNNKPKDSAAAPSTKRDISYNDVRGAAKTAEEELAAFKLPPEFEIELFAKEGGNAGKFIVLNFDQKGRLWSNTAFEYPVDANENPAAADALYQSKARDKVLVFDHPFTPGPHQPRVFAEGLAIPEGVLAFKDGAIVQHGHDIEFLRDTDGDGKADKKEVILSGFGVQDSHLFPHQFTRAPLGWMWLAQGAFNNGMVHTTSGQSIEFPSTRMARFRPDGSDFEPTSTGPCNIWGLVLTGEGEAFIQEANDYGYPVMPFHEYANYPGCADKLFKSYAPHFPVQAPDFKMGGTGLSGLALTDKGLWPAGYDDVMYVANPIISKIQAIKMHRDGPRYKLELRPDFIECSDPFFRPVAITIGPDGCLYIVDWYNKIISHNEVARNHPDRDKSRGRIWRVKPKSMKKIEVPDFTQLSAAELIAKLGSSPTAQAHLAWQALADRQPNNEVSAGISALVANEKAGDAARIQALWVLAEQHQLRAKTALPLLKSANRNVRHQVVDCLAEFKDAQVFVPVFRSLAEDADAEVRFAAIRALGRKLKEFPECFPALLTFARPSLDGPTAPSRNGKAIKVGEAYEREFERYLVRMFLERQPELTAKLLDTTEATKLPVEARVLASLALEPKASAARVAKLLPQLSRAPNEEELFRLAQFPEQPGCGEALKALLSSAQSRAAVADKLLLQKTKLDPAKIAPLLSDAAKALLGGNDGDRALGVSLIGGFQLAALEADLVAMVKQNTNMLAALQALRELRSSAIEVFISLAKSTDLIIRDEALSALASSKNPKAANEVFALYPGMTLPQQRAALNALSSNKAGAKAMVAALKANTLPKGDLDGPMAERLNIVLGDDKDLAALMQSLGNIFHPVLSLDGQDTAWADTKITLDGPFTVECWVRLAPGIDNADGILGAPGGVDMNFFGSIFRVYAGGALKDVVVAKKPMTPDLWTHLAVTRDAKGICRIYQNGELDATGSKPAPAKFENCRVGWSGPAKGTEGSIAEFRVWNRERTASEIRAMFVRSFEGQSKPDGLVFYNPGGEANWGKLGKGARIAKTTDYPPILTKEKADKLDTLFTKYFALGQKKGSIDKGKMLSAICMACHTINGAGGQIGPNLSGAGAMGLEGVLRNIMDPNAAMEAGYRTFRTELKSGDIVDAFYVGEDKEAFVVRQVGLPDRRIPKKDVRTTRYIRRSLMPEGLLDALSDEQVTDLMSYLMTLK